MITSTLNSPLSEKVQLTCCACTEHSWQAYAYNELRWLQSQKYLQNQPNTRTRTHTHTHTRTCFWK